VEIFFYTDRVGKQAAACYVLLPGLLLASSITAAPDLGADTRTISLHEAVAKTIEHNPDLRAFDYQLKAQDGRVQQAGVAPSPQLSLQLEDALGTGDLKGIDSAEATISIG